MQSLDKIALLIADQSVRTVERSKFFALIDISDDQHPEIPHKARPCHIRGVSSPQIDLKGTHGTFDFHDVESSNPANRVNP